MSTVCINSGERLIFFDWRVRGAPFYEFCGYLVVKHLLLIAMQANEIEAAECASNVLQSGCLSVIRQRIIWFVNRLVICCLKPFQDFFASVQRASKRDNNNRTPGEGTCFELGKYNT